MKLTSEVSRTIATGRSKFTLLLSGIILISGSFLPAATQMVLADSLQDQINALNQQNSNTANTVSGLQTQAASYQDEITQLQQQINGIQASINANKAEQANLQQDILNDQQQITQEKAVLADDVKTMYVDGTPSTLEVLATSKNLSDFVDKQEYRTSVQNKLQDTLNTIAQLQDQLQNKRAAVDQLLGDEQSQQNQLASTESQQASLLNYNQSQQATYNAQIQANNAQISQLEVEQAAENAKLGNGLVSTGTCGGGYPAQAQSPVGGYWGCNYPQDNTLDNWGMYNRECVSYTAFKVYQTYGYMPYWGGSGNAIQWIGDAKNAGIPTSHTPKVHSVAIWNVGPDGHAMWVEAVNPDGSIFVSQYNYSYNGTYSEMTVSAAQAATFTYIYFN
ncbi:MAG TPA: CHAP domain-containing protein [Verrucomicrobiae bacterium]|nr:CHAP domain-containing protein [Verrucomicrobiae bacterium]